MDYVRSCYSVNVWGFNPATGLFVKEPIRWFRAPAGATPLGIRHNYASYNWEKPAPYTQQIGEVIGDPRPWSNGATPKLLTGLGHCGPAAAWTQPIVHGPPQQPLHSDGQWACCPEKATVPCSSCVGGLGLAIYTMTVTGGTGTFAGFNGVHQLANVGTCLWDLVVGSVVYSIGTSGPTFTAEVQNVSTGTNALYSSPAGWDCLTDVGPWTLFSHAGAGTPPTVSIR